MTGDYMYSKSDNSYIYNYLPIFICTSVWPYVWMDIPYNLATSERLFWVSYLDKWLNKTCWNVSFFFFKQTIKATSPLGDPRVTYNLEDGMVPETNMPVRFYLTPNREDGSASILVAEPLDYETTRNFMLRVRAQNVAAVPLAAFTMVYVNVTGEPCLN